MYLIEHRFFRTGADPQPNKQLCEPGLGAASASEEFFLYGLLAFRHGAAYSGSS